MELQHFYIHRDTRNKINSSDDEIEEGDQNIHAVTTEVRSTKSNTIIFIPLVYPGDVIRRLILKIL